MNLPTLLRDHRKTAKLTQEEIAEKIGDDINSNISPKTVSNWESGRITIPGRNCWGSIMKIYGIDRQEFACAILDAQVPENGIPEEFPTCMFSDEALQYVQGLRFSPQETELIRMLNIYNEEWKVSGTSIYAINKILDHLPYEYVKDVGAGELEKMAISIQRKIFNDEIQEVLISWLTMPEDGNTITAFDIFDVCFDCVWEIAKAAKRKYIERDTDVFSMYLLDAIKNIKSGKEIVFEMKPDTGENVKNTNSQTQRWKNFVRALDEDPDLLLRRSKEIEEYFQYFYKSRQVLMHDKTRCFKDDWETIIRCHEIDCGIKDEEYTFSYEVLVEQYDCDAPFDDWVTLSYTSQNGSRRCTASLTEKGEFLYQYCLKNRYLASWVR